MTEDQHQKRLAQWIDLADRTIREWHFEDQDSTPSWWNEVHDALVVEENRARRIFFHRLGDPGGDPEAEWDSDPLHVLRVIDQAREIGSAKVVEVATCEFVGKGPVTQCGVVPICILKPETEAESAKEICQKPAEPTSMEEHLHKVGAPWRKTMAMDFRYGTKMLSEFPPDLPPYPDARNFCPLNCWNVRRWQESGAATGYRVVLRQWADTACTILKRADDNDEWPEEPDPKDDKYFISIRGRVIDKIIRAVDVLNCHLSRRQRRRALEDFSGLYRCDSPSEKSVAEAADDGVIGMCVTSDVQLHTSGMGCDVTHTPRSQAPSSREASVTSSLPVLEKEGRMPQRVGQSPS